MRRFKLFLDPVAVVYSTYLLGYGRLWEERRMGLPAVPFTM